MRKLIETEHLTPEIIARRVTMSVPEAHKGPLFFPLTDEEFAKCTVPEVSRNGKARSTVFSGGPYPSPKDAPAVCAVITRGEPKAIYFPPLNDYAEPEDVQVDENGNLYIVEEEIF